MKYDACKLGSIACVLEYIAGKSLTAFVRLPSLNNCTFVGITEFRDLNWERDARAVK